MIHVLSPYYSMWYEVFRIENFNLSTGEEQMFAVPKALRLLTISIVLTLVPFSAKANCVIFESATLGPRFSTDLGITRDIFLGKRFTVNTTVQVTRIGGRISGGPLFGAIVRLSGPDALPSGNPFDSALVAFTTFNTGIPLTETTNDFLTPLSVTLEPGTYGLVFGTGQFGVPAHAIAGMPFNNPVLPGTSNFVWDAINFPEGRWRNSPYEGAGTTTRFVIMGIPIGEPMLLMEEDTDRAIALDSVTSVRDPFPLETAHNFSSDGRTRVTLFARNLCLSRCEDMSVVKAEAEDPQLNSYPLTVEAVEKVPGLAWLTQITLKLPDEMESAGYMMVRVKVRETFSNRVRIGIKPFRIKPPVRGDPQD